MESAVTVEGDSTAATALGVSPFSNIKNYPSSKPVHRLYVTKTKDDGKARRLFAETKLAESDRIIETNRRNKLAITASDDADIERFNQEIMCIFNDINNNNIAIHNNTDTPDENYISNDASVNAMQHNEIETNNKNNIPGYLKQTFTSTLPPYTNQDEIARISNCFRTGSNRSLRSLPAQLAPGAVQSAMRECTTKNLLPKLNATSAVSKSIKKDMKTTNGYFHPLKYTGNEYNKEAVISNMKEECDKVFTESFCRKPFKTSSRFITPKGEDVFSSSGGRVGYPSSILGPSTGSADFTKVTRSECMDSTKFLNGPFRVFTGKEREKDRKLAAQWTQQLFKLLLADWGHMKFKVKFTPEDELLVQFIINDNSNAIRMGVAEGLAEQATVLPPEQALSKYMNQLASHGIAAGFGLKKRGDRWGVVEVGSINVQHGRDSTSLKKGGAAKTDRPHSEPSDSMIAVAEQEDFSKILLTYSFLAPWAKNGITFSKEYYAAQSRNKVLAKRAAERAIDAGLGGTGDARSDDSSVRTSESGDTSAGGGIRIY